MGQICGGSTGEELHGLRRRAIRALTAHGRHATPMGKPLAAGTTV